MNEINKENEKERNNEKSKYDMNYKSLVVSFAKDVSIIPTRQKKQFQHLVIKSGQCIH